MNTDQPTIHVLTPNTYLSNNHYMSCLWSSLDDFNVTVDRYRLDRRYCKIKSDFFTGKVIHLHWIKEFCKFDFDNRAKTIRAVLGAMRNLLLIKRRGNKVVWTVHNTFMHENRFVAIEYLLRYFLSKICDDIIVMSDYSRAEFLRMYGRSHRIHNIPIGNYIGVYPKTVSKVQARERLKLSLDSKVFLYVGRVQQYKGISNLLRSFRAIDDPKATLVIAGVCKDFELETEISEAILADSRIIAHLGFIEDTEIQYYLNACDWVVLPFKKILNSASVLLALSFQKPVIVPQKGAITEIVSNSVQGYCYEEDSELVRALTRAVATPQNKWKNMCDEAYKLAQTYDWESIGRKLHQVYTEAVGSQYE